MDEENAEYRNRPFRPSDVGSLWTFTPLLAGGSQALFKVHQDEAQEMM